MAHISITQRLTIELEQLAQDIRQLDEFDQETTLDIHALSCLLRYAAWAEPSLLKSWLLTKKFTINPMIVERVELFTDLEGEGVDQDGVELRIHIFRNSNETFKHSHKQSFITVCLQGEYRFRYYTIQDSDDAEVMVYRRQHGRQSFVETINGEMIEVKYNEYGEMKRHQGGALFTPDDIPMFVDSTWMHTVKHTSEEPVITFVARRGKCTTETTVWRGPRDKDPSSENDSPPRDATQEEKEELCAEIINALLRDQTPRSSGTYWNDIEQSLVATFPKISISQFPDNDAKRKALYGTMQDNSVRSVPVLNENNRCTAVICIPVVDEALDDESYAPFDVIDEPMTVTSSDPLLYAVLAMILNETLVVPIVDEQGGFITLLTLRELLIDYEMLGRALLWSMYQSERDHPNALIFAKKLISALRELYNCCYIAEKRPTRVEHDRLVHNVLTYLDELLILIPNVSLKVHKVTPEISSQTLLTDIPSTPYVVIEEGRRVSDDHDLRWLMNSLSLPNNHLTVYKDGEVLTLLSHEGDEQALTEIDDSYVLGDLFEIIQSNRLPFIIKSAYTSDHQPKLFTLKNFWSVSVLEVLISSERERRSLSTEDIGIIFESVLFDQLDQQKSMSILTDKLTR
jgi:hypothetical protein